MRTLILLMTCLAANAFAAETIVTKRINAQNRLIPLKKITVGPDDQYQGSLAPSGATLVFTKKSDLVPHICSQDMKSGEVVDVLPLSADSQQATVNPSGQMAFTYYKFNARGDICYRPFQGTPEDKMTCLKGEDGERSAPFWKSSDEIGFLVRSMKDLNSQIIVENVKSGEKQVLASGRVWSPSMKPNGRYLFYNEIVQGKRALVMKDLQANRTKVLKFSLPGMSGFPSVSDDETTLFFSHYLNDTNADNTIDGNDNSVIFRANIDTLWKEEATFPEQLTSAESSCSFPKPFGDRLFVTCAFEASLDVYEVPSTGIVPTAWTEALLWNAHQSARSYQERVLLLNTLKYRHKLGSREFDERLLSDHLLAEDASAAKYYVAGLQVDASSEQKAFFSLVSFYLDGLEKKRLQPSEEISRAFEADIMEIDAKVEKVSGQPRLKRLVRGMLRTFLNQPQQALSFLQGVKFEGNVFPIERYFYFELASATLPRAKSNEALYAIYREVMKAPELTEESRLYYAFRFLEFLQKAKASRQDRIDFLAKYNHDFPPSVTALLKAEAATLKIIVAPDATKDVGYRELDQLMSASRADYFLRKGLYIRSILNFADAAEFKFLNFIATNWLRYTANEDTEFAYSREVFVNANLDRAYDTFAQKKYELAGNYFYGALSLTDDLESHYGYLVTMVLKNQRETINERYKNLKEREFIDDNMKFVEAVLGLLDAKPGSRGDTGHLDAAIEKLKAMDQDRDSPVRYLLLGYCYLDKLTRTADGYDFDRDLFEGAHRSLMLAYDIGRDNDRIKAASLMNLGILHQRVQNHGLATKFLAKRKELGFTSEEERARFAWLYGRSLFYNHQPDKATDEVTAALKTPTKFQAALEDRRAFYLQANGDFKAAAKAYEKLITSGTAKGDLNLAKANLGLGYSLAKAKNETGARSALLKSLEHSGKLSVIAKGQDRLVDFQPVRLQLNAYGLLGKVGTDVERLQAMEKRSAIFDSQKGVYDDQLTLMIQIRLQMAQLYSKRDPAKALMKLREAVAQAEKLGDSGMYVSTAVYHAASSYLALGFMKPELYKGESTETVDKVVAKTIQAYDTISKKAPQPTLDYQKLKLQMLQTAFNSKLGKTKTDRKEIKNLVESSAVKGRDIEALADALSE